MHTRPLGKTGLRVSRLGLGMAALGRPGYITLGHAEDLGRAYDPGQMEQHAHRVLDAAFAEGVRYFDAARSYGDGERFLASWLARKGLRPGEVVVGSKWGYTYTAEWRVQAEKHEVKEHSLAVLLRQVKESRALLGEHLTVYQIHSATLESGVLDNNEVLDELRRLREQGWKIGLSLTGPRQRESLRQAGEVGLFDVVQATWNLLERSCDEALREAHAAGMGVIVKEALANGRLTTRNDDASFVAKRRLLEATAERLGSTVDAVALAAVLARPWVDVVLSGAATEEQMRSNAKALQVEWDEEAEHLLGRLMEPPEEYWRKRAMLTWN